MPLITLGTKVLLQPDNIPVVIWGNLGALNPNLTSVLLQHVTFLRYIIVVPA